MQHGSLALAAFANLAFVFGGVFSALYLYQARTLKRQPAKALSRRLPSLTWLRAVAWRSIAAGFAVSTAGLALGITSAAGAGGAMWWAEPSILVSGIVWLTYGIYLVLASRLSIPSHSTARASVAGLVLVVLLSTLAHPTPLGLHGCVA